MASNPRIDELRKRLEKEPQSRLFAQLAEELRKDGDLEEAIRVCREGLQKQPAYPSARMTLGRALFDTGDMAAARAEFEGVLKAAPDNILASRLLGECLEGLGDLPGALARYKTTLALAPGEKQVLARLQAVEERIRVKGPAPTGPPAAPPLASTVPMRILADERTPIAEEPPPIPLVAADETFELERPYEAPAPTLPFAPPALVAPAPPATAPRAPAPRATPATAPRAPAPRATPATAPRAPAPPATPDVLPATVSPATPEIASSTLAELYFNQGFTDKAIEVYRQLLGRESGNERARSRLAELEALGNVREFPPDVSEFPPEDTAGRPALDWRVTRRQAVERTIARLEGLLAALKGSQAWRDSRMH